MPGLLTAFGKERFFVLYTKPFKGPISLISWCLRAQRSENCHVIRLRRWDSTQTFKIIENPKYWHPRIRYFHWKRLKFASMKKFLQTHPPITKAIRFFHTLLAKHVLTLNWVLFRCFFHLHCLWTVLRNQGFGKILKMLRIKVHICKWNNIKYLWPTLQVQKFIFLHSVRSFGESQPQFTLEHSSFFPPLLVFWFYNDW
jgi:hypothetical protein